MSRRPRKEKVIQRRCQQPLDAATIESELRKLRSMVKDLSYITTERLEATTRIRKLLSIERDPPIDKVIEAQVVPYLVNFIERNDLPELQFEAAWALTNIASGTSNHTKAVVDAEAVPKFVNILTSNFRSDDLKEQAIWALGNVAGNSTEYRDMILQLEVMKPLITLVRKFREQFGVNSSKLRTAVRTLSNLCCGKPPPLFEKVKPALHILLRELIYLDDEEVLPSVCWALAYISDFTMHRIAESVVVFLGFLPHFLQLLEHPSPGVHVPTLRIVGNLVTGDNSQTQRVLNCGVLSYLHHFLNHRSRIIRKEACWIISNITTGNGRQIQDVINWGIIDRLVDITQTEDNLEISKEAVWAISNAISGGSHEQIQLLVKKNCIESLCDFLDSPDPSTVKVCLKGLQSILKVEKDLLWPKRLTLYSESIEDFDGLRKMKILQIHEDDEISAKAVGILKQYWHLEEGEEQGLTSGNIELNLPPGGFNLG